MEILGLIVVFGLGFTTAVFTWDWIHARFVSVEAQVKVLEAKIKALRGAPPTTGL